VTADLDTLLIALYVELTDRIIASPGNGGRRVGRAPKVTDAELVCLAVTQVLLRCDDELHRAGRAPAPGQPPGTAGKSNCARRYAPSA